MLAILDEPRLASLSGQMLLLTPAKLNILSAAERMIGYEGLQGAPLYKIAEAAGQSNRYAVQYHFKDREGLIATIFATRLQMIAERRAYLLDKVLSGGLASDIGALLQCIYCPMAEQVDEDGRQSFLRFMLQYFVQPGVKPELDKRFTSQEGPTKAIYDRLCVLTTLSNEELSRRLAYFSFSASAALLNAEEMHDGDPLHLIRKTIAELIPLAVAVVRSPPTG